MRATLLPFVCETTGPSSAWSCRTTFFLMAPSRKTFPSRTLTPRVNRSRSQPIAHCEGIHQRLADSYDTIVGETRRKLSGGHAARGHRRAPILAEPKILILDEATSGLDSEVKPSSRRPAVFGRGRTTFVPASPVDHSQCGSDFW